MSRTHDAPSEKHNIDIKDILKDVEVCLKQGLERKISSFFDDYTMFQRTHNEVLNLSIVKKMLHVNGGECNHDHNEHYKRSETMYHDEYIISRYETEIETLKTENKNLSLELEKYKKYLDFNNHYHHHDNDHNDDDDEEEELLSQPINLEITEKHIETKDTDADSNSILEIQIEKNIKNIVLNNMNNGRRGGRGGRRRGRGGRGGRGRRGRRGRRGGRKERGRRRRGRGRKERGRGGGRRERGRRERGRRSHANISNSTRT